MYQRCSCAVILAALGLAGCQSHPLADSSWPEERPLGTDLKSYRPPAHSIASDKSITLAVVEPSGELTLRQAMALAMMHHPKLQAFAWEVRQAEARVIQAGLWSNPELEIEFENFAGSGESSGSRSMETTISLAQTIPLGGDIERRRALAGYEARLAGWDYEAVRLDVLTEVTHDYVAVLAAQERIYVLRRSLDLAEQVQSTTRRRIDAGDAAPIEATRASVPTAMARISLRQAERQYAAARRQLSLMWGSTRPAFDSVTGSLDQLHEPPAADQLVALINRNPQVARWAVEISSRIAEARLAAAEATPDITGRIGYRRMNGSDEHALVAGISIPLPIFDRRQGDILAARLGEASARRRQRDAELRLQAILSDSLIQLSNAYDSATAIQNDVLPAATEAFDVTNRAFENGDLTFIDVLDAERTLVELQIQRLDALVEYHMAVAEIEGLIGRSLPLPPNMTPEQSNPSHGDN